MKLLTIKLTEIIPPHQSIHSRYLLQTQTRRYIQNRFLKPQSPVSTSPAFLPADIPARSSAGRKIYIHKNHNSSAFLIIQYNIIQDYLTPGRLFNLLFFFSGASYQKFRRGERVARPIGLIIAIPLSPCKISGNGCSEKQKSKNEKPNQVIKVIKATANPHNGL